MSLETINSTTEQSWVNIKERNDLKKEIPNMVSIKNHDFLKISHENRLRYITKDKIESEKLSAWDEVEFTFTFNWSFNKDLFKNTTAGQVLPEKVREVITNDWVTWYRWEKSLKWEFFSPDLKRLIIREWTKININRTENEDYLQNIRNKNDAKLNQNNYNDSEKQIAKKSLELWIDPTFAITAFWSILKSFIWVDKSPKLEDYLTEFARIRWRHSLNDDIINWVYSSKLSLLSMIKADPENWEENARKYWIQESEINNFISRDWILHLDEYKIDNWENLKWNDLLKNQAFNNKLIKVCDYLWVEKEYMIRLMWAESWVNPKAVNSITHKAVWLIQFTVDSWIWVPLEEIRTMSWLDQLNLVKQYFEPYKWKIKSYYDLYLATFYPVAIWKDDDFIFWSQPGSKKSPETITSQNPVIANYANWWYITLGAFKKYIKEH